MAPLMILVVILTAPPTICVESLLRKSSTMPKNFSQSIRMPGIVSAAILKFSNKSSIQAMASVNKRGRALARVVSVVVMSGIITKSETAIIPRHKRLAHRSASGRQSFLSILLLLLFILINTRSSKKVSGTFSTKAIQSPVITGEKKPIKDFIQSVTVPIF